MTTRHFPIFALVVVMGAGVVALAQAENPPVFQPLPKLTGVPVRMGEPPERQTAVSTNEAWRPLPERELGGPPINHEAAVTAKTRSAERQFWESMTNAVFQAQFQQTLLVLKIANQQPEVRAKVEAARQAVRDYVRQHSPEMLPVLEKMSAPRDLQRRAGHLTELVY